MHNSSSFKRILWGVVVGVPVVLVIVEWFGGM